jgi:hypothetical protein
MAKETGNLSERQGDGMTTGQSQGHVRTTGEQTKDELKGAAEQVKQKTSEVAQQVGEEAKSMVSTRKGEAASQLRNVADAFRQTSMQLEDQDQATFADYGNRVADQIERLGSYLESHDTDRLIVDAEGWARRRPELFLGGAFVAGLALGRFLRSSSPRSSELAYPMTDTEYTGPYSYGELQGQSPRRRDTGGRTGQPM